MRRTFSGITVSKMKRLKGQRVYLAGAMDRVLDRGKGMEARNNSILRKS